MTHQVQSRPGLAAKLAEAGLWIVVAACASCWAVGTIEAKATQKAAEEMEMHLPAPSTTHDGQLLGRLEISQLSLDVPILESYDATTLRRGVGHVPGTAVPGGLGNLVLAGHRDTFFRPLRRVQPGMEIQVITSGGRWRYLIDRTEVVQPEQVSVLDIGDVPEMTLITCYPFEFIGAAPQRFIVHAHLISVDAA